MNLEVNHCDLIELVTLHTDAITASFRNVDYYSLLVYK